MTRPAVFLDRDGTVVEERGYIDRLDMLALFPWTSDALRLLRRAGFAVVVVTNQSAIGRGIIDESFLETVHRELDARLALSGAKVDAYYVCPHFSESAIERYRKVCRCRKPGSELVERACADLGLDVTRSFMVGDRWSDVACGVGAGAQSILIRTGHGAHEPEVPPDGVRADAILDNLMAAVGWILSRGSARDAPRG